MSVSHLPDQDNSSSSKLGLELSNDQIASCLIDQSKLESLSISLEDPKANG
jgi:hypothetical protein